MLYPSIFNDSLFDDFMNFDFPTFPAFPAFGRFDFSDVDKKLYGKHAARIMKTDVHEHEDHYEVAIDLPGFKKEDLNLELDNGTLTVTATKGLDKDSKNKEGKLIRQERYSGSMKRSFYVGKNITEEDVKAAFEDGVLKLEVPKKDAPKVPEKKTIAIAG